MKFYVVVKYYLVSLSFKFHEDPCRNARAWVVNARTRDKTCACMFTTCAHACLQLVRSHLFTDLPEIPNLSSQDSIWQPHKISWRSELFLRRYLQNNTDVCLILNIQCIFTNIQNTSPPTHQSVKIILNLLEFLETIYKKVRISGEKRDLSHFVGSLLARVIRSKLISVQLDHPVAVNINST